MRLSFQIVGKSFRALILAAVCLGVSRTMEAQSAPPPAHPVTAEQVKQLMTVTHSADRVREGIHKMIVQQQAALPFFPAGFWTDFEAEMAKVDWIAIATPIYQKHLSTEDADKAIAFYSTDAGQRSLDSSMAVVEEMQAKGFELGKSIGAQLGQKYQTEIQDGMRKAQQSSSPTSTPK